LRSFSVPLEYASRLGGEKITTVRLDRGPIEKSSLHGARVRSAPTASLRKISGSFVVVRFAPLQRISISRALVGMSLTLIEQPLCLVNLFEVLTRPFPEGKHRSLSHLKSSAPSKALCIAQITKGTGYQYPEQH
jgi:hypothetical protein